MFIRSEFLGVSVEDPGSIACRIFGTLVLFITTSAAGILRRKLHVLVLIARCERKKITMANINLVVIHFSMNINNF